MMFTYPVAISRPDRIYDGADVTERLGDSWYIWCNPDLLASDLVLLSHSDEDIQIGDIIEIPYNVTHRR